MNRFSIVWLVFFNGNLTVRYCVCKHCHAGNAKKIKIQATPDDDVLLYFNELLLFLCVCEFLPDSSHFVMSIGYIFHSLFDRFEICILKT